MGKFHKIQKWKPTTLEFPASSGKGRPKRYMSEKRDKVTALLIKTILEIRPGLSFTPGSRGWCYLLEEYGLPKGNFGIAQTIITDARKDGRLPLDICADDDSRAFHNLERLDDTSPEEEAESWIDWLMNNEWENYIPLSFWDDQEYYVEVIVEKIDLLQLFKPACKKRHVPIANMKGWPNIGARAEMMQRFKRWEAKGKECVLLLCGDHDPAGLLICDLYRKMLNELSRAVQWAPNNLIIERFGLNADLIEKAGLSWIENLETSSGKDLANPKHPDYKKPYVQDYIKKFRPRKVEGNALVTRPDLADELIKSTLNKYISEDSADYYQRRLKEKQLEVKSIINEIMMERHM
jgi:hypothetical protein